MRSPKRQKRSSFNLRKKRNKTRVESIETGKGRTVSKHQELHQSQTTRVQVRKRRQIRLQESEITFSLEVITRIVVS